MTSAGAADGRLQHPALLYDSLDHFLGVTVPFVTQGVKNDEVVFVAARGDYIPILRDEVGGAGRRVQWHDTYEWHPHPATRLRAFHNLVTDELRNGARAFRLVGEPVWPNEAPDRVREWQRYESSLNAVLAPYPVSLLCLYDASALDPSILTTARRTHPWVHDRRAEGSSAHFEDPESFLRRWRFELSRVPPEAARLPKVTDLAAARHFLHDQAVGAGVLEERAEDLLAAANELLTNAIRHGGTAADLSTWREDDRFLCQVEDVGPGIGDPLVSYRPPIDERPNGRGLWLARQLVDFIQIDPGPGGTTVRLHVPIG